MTSAYGKIDIMWRVRPGIIPGRNHFDDYASRSGKMMMKYKTDDDIVANTYKFIQHKFQARTV